MRQNLRSTSALGAALLIALIVLIPASATAQQGSALTFGAALTTDFAANVAGGVETESGWLANLDLTAELNGDAIGWPGGSASLYLLGNWGDDPSGWIGDYQVTNNIEAPRAFRVFEAWVQQELAAGRISVLAGLRDLNAEFYVMEAGELFINSSMGIGVALSQTGANGPSIFPNSALAVRVASELGDQFRVRGAVFDAVANNPEDPSETEIRISEDEGALLIGEAEVGPGADSWRALIGGWRYTEPVEALNPADPTLHRDRGLYGIAEGRLGALGDAALHGFAQYGRAPSEIYPVETGWGGGVVATGLFGRDEDRLGLALAAIEGDAFGLEERIWELTYDWIATDFVQLRLDGQWVDFSEGLEDALVLTTRLTIGF